MIDSDILRKYHAERAKGVPAATAMSIARYETTEPKYEFLADLDSDKPVEGTIGPFTVSVRVEADDSSSLGDDDVTGFFTDTWEDGCVKNTRRNWGSDYKWYRPSNYTLKEAYEDFRKAGMSKAVAQDAVRERIDQEMYLDANRSYWGVIVEVGVDGYGLADASLWSIDEIPGYDGKPYLMEVTAGLIDEAIDEARHAVPDALKRTTRQATELAERMATVTAALHAALEWKPEEEDE